MERNARLTPGVFPLAAEEAQREHALRQHFAQFWAKAAGEPRAVYDRFIAATPLVDTVRLTPVKETRVSGWWVHPDQPVRGQAILYLHGGGFVQGSALAYRGFASQLASRTQVPVLVIDYPLAPEAQVQETSERVLAAWQWLCGRGFRHIAVVGDSAGGGLTLALLARLAQQPDGQQPAAGVAFSPWTDLAFTGASMLDPNVSDPLIGHAYLQTCARQYLGDCDPRDPLASPLYAELAGLAPVLLQVGSDERLLDDARQFAERAWQAGVEAHLDIWKGLHHVFQLDVAHLRSSGEALDRAAQFIQHFLNNHA